MANHQLPLNADGVCMLCKETPAVDASLTCILCATPWHVNCLSVLPETMSMALKFECPDCSGDGLSGAPAPADLEKKDLFDRIREIEANETLTETEKARKRQEVLSGEKGKGIAVEEDEVEVDGVLGVILQSFKCCYCMELPQRPVTTPCGHNFCLKCFEKGMKQGRQTCVKCRSSIPQSMVTQPHINASLVTAIRVARLPRSTNFGESQIVHRFLHNQDRPDKAFTSERAQKPGMANASGGRTFVTSPQDHFGPILAEHDPERNTGVLVGETWDYRQEVKQWGIHCHHVGGICGKARYGSPSIAISGGYEDDEDHGEWLIYTGSGGRDLSDNKRTNKDQSSDQDFTDYNQALRLSCYKGYPVRVLRSNKAKGSPYAPKEAYRYDGVYRVEKCWRKAGIQGHVVCRYLLVRCDNEPAPWTSDEHGDRPRKLPTISELRNAFDISERTESPSWDFDEEKSCWTWKKPPPPSTKNVVEVKPEEREKSRKVIWKAQNILMKEKLLKGFNCLICKKVMNQPLTTPCAHNYCKPCLENAFAGQSSIQQRVCRNGRQLRSRKSVLKCPSCPTDLSEFLQNPQVNREIEEVIEKLQTWLKDDQDVKEEREGEAEEQAETGLKRNNCSSGEIEEAGDSKKRKVDGEEGGASSPLNLHH